MGRVALGTIVLAALTASAASGSSAPKWTAMGEISKLNARTITVHNKSCQITSASPARSTLRLYFIGAEAKIACRNGVLRAIDVLKQLPTIVGKPTIPSTTSQAPPGASLLTTSFTLSGSERVIAETIVGNFSITALGNGSISAGSGRLTLTCALGDGSPDVGGYEVGSRLMRLSCRNGLLASLTPAS